MSEADVTECEPLWFEAFDQMRARFGLPRFGRTDDGAERERRRFLHFRTTDAGGSFVAEEDGAVVGLAQALLREDLWVLSGLAVTPSAQGKGVARALMAAALGHGDRSRPGIIVASRDPQAVRRYLAAGFRLHPAVTAWGPVGRAGLAAAPDVRSGDLSDVEACAAVSRTVRGAAYGVTDLALFLGEGDRVHVIKGRGFALARDGRCVPLVATDEDAARQLLTAVLAEAPPGADAEVNWLTAEQQWAVQVATAAGMELHPVGPVMLRAIDRPFPYWVPSGALG
jgi:GNAT superfamily N-acetyltransferase